MQVVDAAIIRDRKLYVLHKHGLRWILPGGKPKRHESDRQCLYREVSLEELKGTNIISAQYYGTFTGEIIPGLPLEARVYLTQIRGKLGNFSKEFTDGKYCGKNDLLHMELGVVMRKIVDRLCIENYL